MHYPQKIMAVIFSVASVTVFLPNAFSAAWSLEKGKKQIIYTMNYYTTSSSFDTSGNRVGQDRFTKIENTTYAEYGLGEVFTIGMNASFQHLTQNSSDGPIKNYGLSDTEFFARRELWKNRQSVFSIQPLIKIPGSYDKEKSPRLGNRQFDMEIRGLFGHGFSYFGKNHFSNFELAYRKRMGRPGDEIRLDATVGGRVRDDIMLLLQSVNVFSANNSSAGALQIANSTDFDSNKVQLSVVKHLSEEYSLQIGVFQNMHGKNTGAGGGMLVSLWTSF